jgi:type III secretion protein S
MARMTPQNVLDLTREGLLIVLMVSLPVVVVATVTSLVVAVLQAVTQIQDQTIGQSVRLIAVLLALVIGAGWLGRDVLRFAERAMQTLGTLS